MTGLDGAGSAAETEARDDGAAAAPDRLLLAPSIRDALHRFIEDRTEEQLDFLIRLCHQNSFSWHKEGTDRVAAMILERIGALFSSHRVVPQAEVGDLHLLSNAGDGPSVYLLGHMDTVFPPDHPFQTCRIEDDRLHGPGSGDMKAGLVTIVYAVLALHEAGLLDQVPLTVALAGDEEVGAVTSRPVYEEERRKALACLVVEGGGLAGEIVTSRNGKMGLRVDCLGQDQHVGAVDLRKASAVLELAHKAIGLEGLNGRIEGARVNVGRVEGGLGPATIPARAHALVDVRWREQRVRDDLLARIGEVVARDSLPGCRSELTILNERSAWPVTGGSLRLAEVVRGVGAEMGREIGREHRLGTSDSNFFGCAGVPTVDGLGPVCKGYHTEGEFVYLASIPERTELLAGTLAALGRLHREGRLGSWLAEGAGP